MEKMEDFETERTPDDIMKEALDIGLKDFYVAYSGGKDSGIVLDYVAKEFPKYFRGVLFINTGIGTDETLNFIKEYCKERKYPLHVVRPEDVKRVRKTKVGNPGEVYSYEKLVLRYGFPQQGFHTITMRHLKYFPMRKFIKDRIKDGEKPCIVGGIRKNESKRRKMKWKKYLYNDGKMWFVSPLFFKSNDWVYKYFIENDIKRSPVYDTLHISGDCLCGCFAQSGELEALRMFHPEVYEKIRKIEKKLQTCGTDKAKKNPTWGVFKQSTIKSNDEIEQLVCNECFFDKDAVDEDNKRFDTEWDEIEEKFKGVKLPK